MGQRPYKPIDTFVRSEIIPHFGGVVQIFEFFFGSFGCTNRMTNEYKIKIEEKGSIESTGMPRMVQIENMHFL